MHNHGLPVIIQGGMGAGVSDWRLANAVARTGQLGVVSGTAIDVIVARRLQCGDSGGHIRRALAQFPVPGIADRILHRYFQPAGKPSSQPFKAKPMPSAAPSKAAEELLVASNFVEVYLAKEGHSGRVGINFLEKIQTPTLASLYGAMLAGVSCVLMGAGIPRTIPGILDKLACSQAVELRLDVQGSGGGTESSAQEFVTRFDPEAFWPGGASRPDLVRPEFYAIVSSATLASMLVKKSTGTVDGFVIEGHTAGGHNAPPRGTMQLTTEGEPIYGERDVPDLNAIRALGLPFWLAGSYADPEKVTEARRLGAAGVQVGTAFAYCEESGLQQSIKKQVLQLSKLRAVIVFTDPRASPTGFPFKVVKLPGTAADDLFAASGAGRTKRICDLGYLRSAYRTPEGNLGWRCPAEPVEDYIQKGGREEDTVGRLCVCNGLMANIGLGQIRGETGEEPELPLVTSGDDVKTIARFLKPGHDTYTAADVVEYLLSEVGSTQHA